MAIQWSLVIFSLLAGCGGILLAFVGLGEFLGIGSKVRVRALVISLVLLIVGGCASVLHLGQPANIMAAATNIFSFSGISVELIMLGFNVIVAVIYLIVATRGSEGALKALGVLGIIGGVIIAFVTGNGYVMESQPHWNTITLPLAYLGTALAMGAALYLALLTSSDAGEEEIAKVKPFVLASAAIALVTVLIYGFAGALTSDIVAFWVCAVVIGGIGAVLCVYLLPKQKSLAYASLACAVVGGLGIRCAMWIAGSGFLEFFQDASVRMVLGL